MVGNLHKVGLKFFLKILKITWPSSASYSFVLVFWSRDGSLPTARKIYIAIARRLRGVLNKLIPLKATNFYSMETNLIERDRVEV